MREVRRDARLGGCPRGVHHRGREWQGFRLDSEAGVLPLGAQPQRTPTRREGAARLRRQGLQKRRSPPSRQAVHGGQHGRRPARAAARIPEQTRLPGVLRARGSNCIAHLRWLAHSVASALQVLLYDNSQRPKAVTPGGSLAGSAGAKHYSVYMGYHWVQGAPHQLPVTSYQLPTSRNARPLDQLPVTSYQLPTSRNARPLDQLPVTSYQLPTSRNAQPLDQLPVTSYQLPTSRNAQPLDQLPVARLEHLPLPSPVQETPLRRPAAPPTRCRSLRSRLQVDTLEGQKWQNSTHR